MRLAVIGLGAMGLPIARRLAALEGVVLQFYDIDPARVHAVAALGNAASSVQEAAADADAVITILPADEHVRAVGDELARAMRPGQIYADLSTVAPKTIEEAASHLAAIGVETVSISITRGAKAAESGELALFVSGDEPLLRPALDAIASELRFVEGHGTVKALKIANNMIVGCVGIANCETLVLGKLFGLAPQAIANHHADHGAGSWVLENHIIRSVLRDDLGPGHFSTLNMAKDMRLYLQLAAEHAVASTLAGIAMTCYRGTIAAGFGDHYHPIVIRWLEHIASTGTRRPTSRRREGELLAQLTDGVAAAQALATLDALVLLRCFGVDPEAAREHLRSGSANNDALEAVTRYVRGDAGAYDAAASARALRNVCELADEATAPLVLLETARNIALQLGNGAAPDPP